MAGTRFKAENGILATGTSSNSLFEHEVRVNANLTVNAALLYVGGNLYVTGNSIIAGLTLYDTDILPLSTTGRAIGNSSNRFDGYYQNISVTGNVQPTSNGSLLGNVARRWDTFSTSIDASGNLTVQGSSVVIGSVSIGNTIAVSGNANLNSIRGGNTTITGSMNVSSNVAVGGNVSVVGSSTFTGNVNVQANVSAKAVILGSAVYVSNQATVNTTSTTVVDSFPRAQSYFAKTIISVNRNNTSVHAIEMLIAHENTNVLVSRYAELYNTKLGSFDAVINGSNVDITFTASGAGTYTVNTLRHLLTA